MHNSICADLSRDSYHFSSEHSMIILHGAQIKSLDRDHLQDNND